MLTAVKFWRHILKELHVIAQVEHPKLPRESGLTVLTDANFNVNFDTDNN